MHARSYAEPMRLIEAIRIADYSAARTPLGAYSFDISLDLIIAPFCAQRD